MTVIRVEIERVPVITGEPAAVPEPAAGLPPADGEGCLTIPTARFGELRIPATDLFHMPEGMHGFPDLRHFLLLAPAAPGGLFYWWQAATDPQVAFPCLDVLMQWPDYRIEAGEADVLRLGLARRSALQVLVICSIPAANPRAATANLLGPLVLDGATREAWQLICERSDHRVDAPLFPPDGPGGAEAG